MSRRDYDRDRDRDRDRERSRTRSRGGERLRRRERDWMEYRGSDHSNRSSRRRRLHSKSPEFEHKNNKTADIGDEVREKDSTTNSKPELPKRKRLRTEYSSSEEEDDEEEETPSTENSTSSTHESASKLGL